MRFTVILLPTLAAVVAAQGPLYTFTGVAAGDGLGAAVSGAGDVNQDGFGDAILGAPSDDSNGVDAGAALVISGRDGTVLHTFTGSAAGDAFGSAVAGAGDVDGDGHADLVVGSPGFDNGAADVGRATVFSGKTGAVLYSWNGSAASDGFGGAVAGAGDVDGDGFADVIGSAPLADAPLLDSGMVLVFSGKTGLPLHNLAGAAAGDNFGAAVAACGDLNGDCRTEILVGIPGSDAFAADAGGAEVFSGADGSSLLVMQGDGAGDRFGSAVAGIGLINGDSVPDIAVGAPFDDNNSRTDSGSVRWVSGADGSVLRTSNGTTANDRFGSALASAGDANADGIPDLIVGVPFADVPLLADAGAALVLSGSDGVTLYAFRGDAVADEVGSAVGSTDVNQDGYGDPIVGARRDDRGAVDNGGVQIFARPNTHVLSQRFLGPTSGALYGRFVGRLDDIDKDGVKDFAVGAVAESGNGFTNNGSCRIYSGATRTLMFTFWGEGNADGCGCSAATAGDIDKDGWLDIIVGSWHNSNIGNQNGSARVFSGKDGTLLQSYYGGTAIDHLGWTVGGLGDVNQDTYPDLLITVPERNGSIGEARVYSGKDQTLLHTAPGTIALEKFGTGADVLNDVDNDGVNDYVVGGAQHTNSVGPGIVKIISGATGATIHTFNGDVVGDGFGRTVRNCGDVDGDLRDDIVVGAGSPSTRPGYARVFSSASGNVIRTIVSTVATEQFGWSCEGGIDFDGDGIKDFAVAAPASNASAVLGGSVYVFSGQTGGLLQRFDGTLPLDGLGLDTIGMLHDLNSDGLGDLLAGGYTSNRGGFQSGAAELWLSRTKRPAGVYWSYGSACLGSAGALPHTGVTGLPILGATFQSTLVAAPSNAAAVWHIGVAAKNLDLTSIGMPGCLALNCPLLGVGATVSGTGKAAFSIQVPNTPALVGGTVFTQWLMIDPPANALGVIAADGVGITIGS